MEKMNRAAPVSSARRYDYQRWSLEELQQFAQQMHVRDARGKSRRQLVELFDFSSKSDAYGSGRPLPHAS